MLLIDKTNHINVIVVLSFNVLKIRGDMELKNLAEMFAILTILEPDTKICQLTARLAAAGSATEGETDTAVIKEIKGCLSDLQKELNDVNNKKLQAKEKLLTRILTPDA
ncbi:hypothetical protein IQ226_18360 [Dolichospermum sp. LEGE 00240]|uniref:hypothetical protein n=1 Tax=Dolichospermum sp. LEGE 00240 TaxID=1828603 RepID=UPI00187E1F3C|nr:hypothetical protein [Dolichospermum sp. LEGE 00240]MBE9251055.1 hypothetical protein [Dolichospermum sp. LEGE 00240]MDM3845480.1 hypothetical protein [Aphanizomenon gracile PMC638.10]MDM3852286.1 hypothetical protein [Aphanizomenon gracile PMC627.10]MDM3856078.1 hypothetical protein [Aphanizomenon gracile PMC649.10]